MPEGKAKLRDISLPTNLTRAGSVTLGADGKFALDGDMPDDVRLILEEIAQQKGALFHGGGIEPAIVAPTALSLFILV